jgi:hypothetical protein
MNDSLGTYLADHLAGAMHAIEVLKNIRSQYGEQPLGQFARNILKEVEADRDTLQELAERVGSGSSTVKETAAWVAEKFSRLKLSHDPANGIGTFEALEFLVLGIHGKLVLWRALASVSSDDSRLQGMGYQRLIARAESQYASVEEHRLSVARSALYRSSV